MARQAPEFPWLPEADGDSISPVYDPTGEIVLLIPEDHPIEAQGTSRVLAAMTTLLRDYARMSDTAVRRELTRISLLDVAICVFTGIGVAAGFA